MDDAVAVGAGRRHPQQLDALAVEEVASFRMLPKYVSVGSALNGTFASPSRASTFSCARIAAPSPTPPMSPDTLPPVKVLPAIDSFSLPPV